MLYVLVLVVIAEKTLHRDRLFVFLAVGFDCYCSVLMIAMGDALLTK